MLPATNDAVTNIAGVSATADFDGDGTANHDEFYLGLDPTDPLSTFAIQDFTRTNSPTLFFYANTNRTYWLQRSPTLLNPA